MRSSRPLHELEVVKEKLSPISKQESSYSSKDVVPVVLPEPEPDKPEAEDEKLATQSALENVESEEEELISFVPTRGSFKAIHD